MKAQLIQPALYSKPARCTSQAPNPSTSKAPTPTSIAPIRLTDSSAATSAADWRRRAVSNAAPASTVPETSMNAPSRWKNSATVSELTIRRRCADGDGRELALDPLAELVVGGAERLHALALELVGDRGQIDPCVLGSFQGGGGLVGIGVERAGDFAVIGERLERLLGHRVDHVGPDQIGDVQGVG